MAAVDSFDTKKVFFFFSRSAVEGEGQRYHALGACTTAAVRGGRCRPSANSEWSESHEHTTFFFFKKKKLAYKCEKEDSQITFAMLWRVQLLAGSDVNIYRPFLHGDLFLSHWKNKGVIKS